MISLAYAAPQPTWLQSAVHWVGSGGGGGRQVQMLTATFERRSKGENQNENVQKSIAIEMKGKKYPQGSFDNKTRRIIPTCSLVLTTKGKHVNGCRLAKAM